MDPTLQKILSQQQAVRFAGFSGSDINSTIRIADPLLNQLIAAQLPPGGPLRSVTVRSHAGNRLGVTLTLARPAFLPPITLTLAVERQATLANDGPLVCRVTGAVGGLMHLAASFIAKLNLPPGIRLDAEHVHVDVRELLRQRGLEDLLEHVKQLTVTTEERRTAVTIVAHVA